MNEKPEYSYKSFRKGNLIGEAEVKNNSFHWEILETHPSEGDLKTVLIQGWGDNGIKKLKDLANLLENMNEMIETHSINENTFVLTKINTCKDCVYMCINRVDTNNIPDECLLYDKNGNPKR